MEVQACQNTGRLIASFVWPLFAVVKPNFQETRVQQQCLHGRAQVLPSTQPRGAIEECSAISNVGHVKAPPENTPAPLEVLCWCWCWDWLAAHPSDAVVDGGGGHGVGSSGDCIETPADREGTAHDSYAHGSEFESQGSKG